MKQIIWFLLLVGLLTTTSCSSDDIPQPDNEEQEIPSPQEIEITVGMPNNETGNSKVIYDDNSLNFTWEEGDQIVVVGFTEDTICIGKQIFNFKEMVPGTDNKVAKFVGKLVEGAHSYYLYYNTPQLTIQDNGEAIFNYDGQIQTADNTTTHLKDYLYLKSPYLTEINDLEKGNFIMEMQNAIMRFDINFLPNANDLGKITEVYWIFAYGKIQYEQVSLLKLAFNPQSPFKIYLSFNPDFNYPNGFEYFRIRLKGDEKIYDAVPNSSTSIKYGRGYRYYITVTDKNTDKYRNFTWQELEQQNYEIWYKTTEVDYKPKGFNVFKVYGTDYMRIYPQSDLLIPLEKTFKESIFTGSYRITEIILPNTIKVITENSFVNNTNLATLKFRPGTELSSIEQNAFKGCTNLRNIILPPFTDSGSIGNYAFSGCTSINFTTLPTGLSTIQTGCFKGCTGLTSMTILDDVTEIGEDAFLGCTNLETFKMNRNQGSKKTLLIKRQAFDGTRIKSLDFPLKTNFDSRALLNLKELRVLKIRQYEDKINNKSTLFGSDTPTHLIDLYLNFIDTIPDEVSSYKWAEKTWHNIIPIDNQGNTFPQSGLPNIEEEDGF